MIFGESAGGMACGALLGSPLSKGKKTRLFVMPFYATNASVYRDRLGTNILVGKALLK
jgi:carboxylesterase type B